MRLEVRDLLDGSEPRLMMPASRKGKGRKAKSHYPVPISAHLAERLAAMDRSANAPLLTRPGGKPWRRSNQAYPFRRVASACGQDPAEVTMYALRHSSIVRQLLAGVPVRIVAAGHDTSVAMGSTSSVKVPGTAARAGCRSLCQDQGDPPLAEPQFPHRNLTAPHQSVTTA